MRHGMSKLYCLKLRCYADRMIDINDYLSIFFGSKTSDKNCEMELDQFLLDIMPNGWSRQADVQGFDCETITLKKL